MAYTLEAVHTMLVENVDSSFRERRACLLDKFIKCEKDGLYRGRETYFIFILLRRKEVEIRASRRDACRGRLMAGRRPDDDASLPDAIGLRGYGCDSGYNSPPGSPRRLFCGSSARPPPSPSP